MFGGKCLFFHPLNHRNTNLSICSADFLSVFLCPKPPSLSDWEFWSHTGTRWSVGAGTRDWFPDLIASSGERSGALKLLARTSSSAVILTSSRDVILSASLKTPTNTWYFSLILRKLADKTSSEYFGWLSFYLDTWPSSLLLLFSSHSALSRSTCSWFLIPIPVFRISAWTLYSLMTVFIPGIWVTRTFKEENKKGIPTWPAVLKTSPELRSDTL